MGLYISCKVLLHAYCALECFMGVSALCLIHGSHGNQSLSYTSVLSNSGIHTHKESHSTHSSTGGMAEALSFPHKV